MKYWQFLLIILIFISGCVQHEASIGENNSENKIQQPCTGEECALYCEQHSDECRAFCEQNPSAEMCQHANEQPKNFPHPPQQPQIKNVSLTLPFDPSNYRYEKQGIWPFCVHGGDHPEGHGGIDFELAPNTPILAAADGIVEYIEGKDTSPHHWGAGVHIVSEAQVVGYVCLVNITVKEGDRVHRGDILGYPCSDDKGTHFIHFEVGDFIREKRVCPLEYMTEETRQEVEKMFSKAHYPEQTSEPELCNCEGVPLPH